MIGIVQTGGTIASDEVNGGPAAPIPSDRFRELWDRLMPRAPVPLQWLDAAEPLDSTEMTPASWAEIMGLVLDAAEREAKGIVVLHGTDTLAQSAAALAFLSTVITGEGRAKSRLGLPLVITGSMKPLFRGDELREESDAQANVTGAIRLANGGAPETHVHFGGRTLPAAAVVKADDRAEAFVAPKTPADLEELAPAKLDRLRRQLDELAPRLGRKAVLTWLFEPQEPDQHATALGGAIEALGSDLGAIHLIGYGTGNVPASDRLLPVLKAVHERGVPVVVGTNVHRGDTDTNLYAAGAWTSEAGAVPAGNMTIPATHAKLSVGLALADLHGWDCAALERFIATPVAGERSEPVA